MYLYFCFSSFVLFCLLIQAVSSEDTHATYCVLGFCHILCLIVHALLWLKCHGGDVFAFVFHLSLSVSIPSMTLASWCVWDWSPQYIHMYYFVYLDRGSLTSSSFGPLFELLVTSSLFVLGGFFYCFSCFLGSMEWVMCSIFVPMY